MRMNTYNIQESDSMHIDKRILLNNKYKSDTEDCFMSDVKSFLYGTLDSYRYIRHSSRIIFCLGMELYLIYKSSLKQVLIQI